MAGSEQAFHPATGVLNSWLVNCSSFSMSSRCCFGVGQEQEQHHEAAGEHQRQQCRFSDYRRCADHVGRDFDLAFGYQRASEAALLPEQRASSAPLFASRRATGWYTRTPATRWRRV
jgi:hypothetical protein